MSARYASLLGVRVLGHLAAIGVAAFAISRILEVSSDTLNVFTWLVAGAVLHDAVLLPLYSAADLGARRVIRDRRVINHLRFPAIVSLILLLVYSPTILDRNPGRFELVSGRPQPTHPLEAWLWITVALFAASAVVLAVRVIGDRRRVRS